MCFLTVVNTICSFLPHISMFFSFSLLGYVSNGERLTHHNVKNVTFETTQKKKRKNWFVFFSISFVEKLMKMSPIIWAIISLISIGQKWLKMIWFHGWDINIQRIILVLIDDHLMCTLQRLIYWFVSSVTNWLADYTLLLGGRFSKYLFSVVCSNSTSQAMYDFITADVPHPRWFDDYLLTVHQLGHHHILSLIIVKLFQH